VLGGCDCLPGETEAARTRRRGGERALRYERALVYEDLSQRRRARSELEKLYAEAPDYEDVALRLGIAAVTPKGGEET
jgi:predicted Zn-dependent protease